MGMVLTISTPYLPRILNSYPTQSIFVFEFLVILPMTKLAHTARG
jgi:hypothetical protein